MCQHLCPCDVLLRRCSVSRRDKLPSGAKVQARWFSGLMLQRALRLCRFGLIFNGVREHWSGPQLDLGNCGTPVIALLFRPRLEAVNRSRAYEQDEAVRTNRKTITGDWPYLTFQQFTTSVATVCLKDVVVCLFVSSEIMKRRLLKGLSDHPMNILRI